MTTTTLPHITWVDILVDNVYSPLIKDEHGEMHTEPICIDMVTWDVRGEEEDALHIFQTGSWDMVFERFSVVGGPLVCACEKAGMVGARRFDPPLMLHPEANFSIRLRIPAKDEGAEQDVGTSSKVRFYLHGRVEK